MKLRLTERGTTWSCDEPCVPHAWRINFCNEEMRQDGLCTLLTFLWYEGTCFMAPVVEESSFIVQVDRILRTNEMALPV